MSRPTDANGTLVVKTPTAKIVGWLVIAFSVFLGVGWWVAGDTGDAGFVPALGVSCITLAFFCLGAALVALTGSIEMNSNVVLSKSPWGHYSMRWDEVERIETEPDDPDPRYWALGKMALLFVGKDKRLSTLGPSYWRGNDMTEMFGLLESQIEERGIEVRRSRAALWRVSKNTRVARTYAAGQLQGNGAQGS